MIAKLVDSTHKTEGGTTTINSRTQCHVPIDRFPPRPCPSPRKGIGSPRTRDVGPGIGRAPRGPNARHPLAAMAGALGVVLEKRGARIA